jgi:glutamate racemase
MRIALINSGLGLLAAAAALRQMRPDADLVLAMDPDGMPWGAREPAGIAERSLMCARAAASLDPDVLVFACNTGSVHALGLLREEFEPALPVIGTVPAIKPAAAAGEPAAIWATAATTGSAYQRGLIEQFAAGVPVAEVACPGLADAVHAGDVDGIAAAVASAASRTPPGTRAVVLGCTEYELAGEWIQAALPGVGQFGSAHAVAAQALRRAAAGDPGAGDPAASDPAASRLAGGRLVGGSLVGGNGASTSQDGGGPTGSHLGEVSVLLSGRRGELPAAALRYPEGRLLAGLPAQPASA